LVGRKSTQIRECGFQQRFLINVWVGIIGNRFIRPHVLPQHLNGEEYVVNFLQNVLNDLLDDVPLLFRRDPVTFLWGHFKQIVFETQVNPLEE
jgi:hypothetical protein